MYKCFNCEACMKCESKKGRCRCIKLSVDLDNETIKFGKHKGMSFIDMKENYPDYLQWAISSIPKNKLDNKLYDYIYVNRDEIAEKAGKKRRR